MALNRKLSLLELTTLGVAEKQGPMTAYALMRNFADSRAGYYRSKAGSIYPLVKRLTAAGLLQAEPVSGRADNLYAITDAGRAELKAWLNPPFSDEEFTCAVDPFRTRVYHLNLLSTEERREFFSTIKGGLNALLDRLDELIEQHKVTGDRLDILAVNGAISETKARLKWLATVEADLTSSPPE